MARLNLIRSATPRALLEAAAADLLRVPAVRERPGAAQLFASPPSLLVLRQGGLRDDLLSIAAERGVPGWFDPPICLFQDFHAWLGSTGRKPCGDYERLVLVARLLEEHGRDVFAKLAKPDAFVDAVERLFGELVSEGVTAPDFEAACQRRTARDRFEQLRDNDLIRCYGEYLALLEIHGRRDGRDTLVDAAYAIQNDPEAFAEQLGHRRVIHIVGLQDLRGGWNLLLDALRNSPVLDSIGIYTTASIDEALRIPPDSMQWIQPEASLATRLFTAETPGPNGRAGKPAIACISAPDSDREFDEVAQRVRKLLDDGVLADRIAIVARSARPAVDRMVDVLARRGIPASARHRHAFAGIPVIRSVLSLFNVAAEGWTRHGLVELAEQPYFASTANAGAPARRLDATVLNHIGYRRRTAGLDEWIRAHEELLAMAREHEVRRSSGEEDERRSGDAPPRADRVERALDAFRSFSALAADLDRPRTLREWVRWLETFLEEDPWQIREQIYRVPDSRFDVARIDAAGLYGLRTIVQQWGEALGLWSDHQQPMAVSSFASQLREVLSGDIPMWTPTRRGVQVLEALAAAHRSFDHVFLVGLSADNVPLRPHRSPVLDDGTRRELAAAGLPLDTRTVWESRERDLLRILVAGATSTLTCSWPRADAEGRDLTVSAFAEEIVIAAAGEDAWQALARLERDPIDEPQSGWQRAADNGFVPRFELSAAALSFAVIPASLVVTDALPLIAHEPARAYAVHAAVIERSRRSGALSPWNGAITDPDLLAWLNDVRLGETTHVWSATQLEAYAKCPWSWFSQRLLRLDDLDDPDLDVDPMVRGTVMHEALARFYNAARERVGGPVFLRSADLDWATPMAVDAFRTAIASTGSLDWLGPPALRPTKQAELERMLVQYIRWEAEWGDGQHEGHFSKKQILRTAVHAHEHAFGESEASGEAEDLVLELAGTRFRVRGSIDRVEIGIDDRIQDADRYVAAIDYKSGVYSTPGSGKAKAWDDNVVLQTPLYALVLERATGRRVSRIEYRAIKQRSPALALDLVTIRKEGLREETEKREQLERALEAAGEHVKRARAGQFAALPAPSCACPPFCHAWDICRTRNGPKTAW